MDPLGPNAEASDTSSYLTCKRCNSLLFIDAITAEVHFKLDSNVQHLNSEALPVCTGCGKTDKFVLGVWDFTEEIAKEKERVRLQKEKEKLAAIDIQRVYRGMLGRQEYKRMLKEKLELKRRMKYGSLCFQKVWRGHLGRRAFRVFEALRFIGECHPKILDCALRQGGEVPNVLPRVQIFWYERQAELQLLHRDFRILVERTGKQPPLHVVEKNIIEIGRRVVELLSIHARRIQAVFRGMIGREFLREYRMELARYLSRRLTAALTIQAAVRQYVGRCRRQEKSDIRKKKLFGQRYRKEVKIDQLSETYFGRAHDIQRSFSHYRDQSFTEKAVDQKQGTRMAITPSDQLDSLMQLQWNKQKETMAKMTQDKLERSRRVKFIEKKKTQHPSFRMYFDQPAPVKEPKFNPNKHKKKSRSVQHYLDVLQSMM